MVDVVDPIEEYSAARFAREAAAVIRDITARGRLPILVGGTGFYYRALTRGLFDGPGGTSRCDGGWSRSRRGAARRPCTDGSREWIHRRRSYPASRRQAARARAGGLAAHTAAR